MNTLFPGRPDYTGPASGVFGLLHHETLVETSHDVNERIAYVKRAKPKHEVAIRLYNMIYLGNCKAAVKYDVLTADYAAKRGALYDNYEAKRAPLAIKVTAYIRKHIPDTAWNGSTLVF